MKKYLKNPYIVTFLTTLFILLVVFVGKGIFPFGKATLIYGDMHDQITAFYYHLYDCFKGDASLLVNFTTSGGINFFGIMAYYILSPFSLIVLLFKRENIYLAVSIVIALKILTSSMTCLYAIRCLFKEKLSFLISIILAISYAFSGYSLILYQITPWMDAMYLFPLVAIGLKKVLDLEKPYLYIITLTLSLIFSFYTTCMSLILIFLLSFIYIVCYKKRKDFKGVVSSLGIFTVISVGLSMFIVLPSYLQIMDSARMGFSFISLINSKTGPITDKISYFLPSAFLLVANALLILDFRRYKKFLKWYVPSLLILGLPYIVEPINKIIHFFSYAFFPNRYGYMMFFLLVVGAAYYFVNAKEELNQKHVRRSSVIAITMTLLTTGVTLILTYLNYERIQEAVYKLTISRDKYLIFVLMFMCIAIMIGITSVIFAKKNKRKYPYIFVLVLVHTLCCTTLYMGLTSYQDEIREPYEAMFELESKYDEADVYRLKTNTSSLITNNGMVTRYHNLDHFTSLTQDSNLKFLKILGYSSHWTKTYSKNGSLFSDVILANKYYLTKESADSKFYNYIDNKDGYKLYEFNRNLSYGYFTENVKFDEKVHTFDFQNKLYQALTNTNDTIFKVHDEFDYKNLKITTKNKRTSYEIIDPIGTNYLEYIVNVEDEANLYLQVFNSYNNTDDSLIYKSMKIYVNDVLYKSEYPKTTSNGSLYLGTFDNEEVNIKIEFIYDVNLSYIEIGQMSTEKLFDFIDSYKVNSKVSFNKNKINVQVDSDKSGLFFIPVTYDDGYSVTVNGKEQEVVAVYDNFLGVNLKSGNNNIEFTYTSPGLKIGLIISIVSLVGLLLLVFKDNYLKIINNKVIGTIIEGVYLLLYLVLLLCIYIVPFVCFVLSYFFYIS